MANSIHFHEHGLAEMEQFFEALQAPPVKLIARLEQALTGSFLATQAATHIITGALKASGKTSSDLGPVSWEGTITYGGPSVPHEVDYAIYEMARGDIHDFMAPAVAREAEFEAIMHEPEWWKWWEGTTRE